MDTPPKRGPGRPRTRLQGEPNSEAMVQWRAELLAMGGGDVRAYLGPEALQALRAMAPKRKRGPLIERLILAEWHARQQAQRQLQAKPVAAECSEG